MSSKWKVILFATVYHFLSLHCQKEWRDMMRGRYLSQSNQCHGVWVNSFTLQSPPLYTNLFISQCVRARVSMFILWFQFPLVVNELKLARNSSFVGVNQSVCILTLGWDEALISHMHRHYHTDDLMGKTEQLNYWPLPRPPPPSET